MTTQTVQIHTFDYGSSLSSATLRSIADDTLVATADSVNEVTTDSGLYAAVFGEASVISAGTYRLRAVVSGQPINRYVTLAGTDNEVVQARSERLAELDSASRLAIWNTLTTETFTANSFGDLLIISDGTNGREVKVTGAGHIAAVIHDVQPNGLSGSTQISNIENASGYLLAVLAGACADPQTASETYAITVFGSTFTVDMAGQDSTGTRTAPTLTKT